MVRRQYKLVIIVFVTLLLLGLYCLQNTFLRCASASIHAQSEYTQSEQKVICKATVDDNFAENSIIVTLTKAASLLFLKYTPASFSEINCIEVEDLSDHTANYIKPQIDNEISKSEQ